MTLFYLLTWYHPGYLGFWLGIILVICPNVIWQTVFPLLTADCWLSTFPFFFLPIPCSSVLCSQTQDFFLWANINTSYYLKSASQESLSPVTLIPMPILALLLQASCFLCTPPPTISHPVLLEINCSIGTLLKLEQTEYGAAMHGKHLASIFS